MGALSVLVLCRFLQHKGAESNRKRIGQTVMFIGLSGVELIPVAFDFALEIQRALLRLRRSAAPPSHLNIGSYNRMSLVSDRKPNIY